MFFLGACAGNNSNTNRPSGSPSGNSNSDKGAATKTNVEELGMLVNIPYEAIDTVWRDDAPNKKLIAVLRFSTADCEKIVADATRIKPAAPAVIQSESWFPDELIAQGELSGDDTLKGMAYAANNFFQDSFNDGRLVRIDGTDYFVLEANAK